MVMRESLVISLSGLFIGCAASLALSRLVAGLLFGVEPIDPATYAAITLLLLAVALAASYGPARRATKIDPMITLRDE
jgi:ABC-type antimicrobial peptide transport system permease subunit